AAVLPEYLPVAFEMFSSILYPSLRDDDFNMEKQVILEEIGMYDDLPTFTAYEKLMQTHFAGHPLSNSILGTVESIKKLTAEQMREYHQTHYLAGNITLAIAGNIEWSTVVDLANKHCKHWPAGESLRDTTEAQPHAGKLILPRPASLQEHVAQMTAAPPSDSPLRFAADVLTTIIGDDTNSRLYWELIEPGRAEAAEISYNDYDGSAAYMSFLTCNPEDVKENLEAMTAIYEHVNRHGVTAQELEQTKNKIASRIVLRSERPMGRLSSLGSNWVYRKEYRSIEDDLEMLQSLTLEDIQNLLKQYPLGQLSTVAIGPLESLPV
ncbi:MAG: insulinase family protein, partial [Planctomycetaceae bacterium]|nr:insulinase family protein [Planctomycetaceae bacterium]